MSTPKNQNNNNDNKPFSVELVVPPAKQKKYRTAANFVEYSVLYQQSLGYDVKTSSSTDKNPLVVSLTCSTSPTCPFNLTADFTTFTKKLAGQTGYLTSESPYEIQHNHNPPFFPLNLAEERRRKLAGGSGKPILTRKSEVADFLAQINPDLLSHYEIFSNLGFFDSNIGELTGHLDEKSILDLLAQKEGDNLPAFAKAEVAEGIKRYRSRIQLDPNDTDGSLLRGAEREQTIRFVQKMIDEGAAAREGNS